MTAFALRLNSIRGYSILIAADHIAVLTPDGHDFAHPVPNYGTSIAQLAARPGFRVGWARFPDDAEVLYLYDRDDDGFGYALNVDYPDCSEWGYSPFGDGSEAIGDAG
jgi:hypothetical protein